MSRKYRVGIVKATGYVIYIRDHWYKKYNDGVYKKLYWDYVNIIKPDIALAKEEVEVMSNHFTKYELTTKFGSMNSV